MNCHEFLPLQLNKSIPQVKSIEEQKSNNDEKTKIKKLKNKDRKAKDEFMAGPRPTKTIMLNFVHFLHNVLK